MSPLVPRPNCATGRATTTPERTPEAGQAALKGKASAAADSDTEDKEGEVSGRVWGGGGVACRARFRQRVCT